MNIFELDVYRDIRIEQHTSEFEDLGCEILEDSRCVHCSFCTDAHVVLRPLLQVTVDTSNRELIIIRMLASIYLDNRASSRSTKQKQGKSGGNDNSRAENKRTCSPAFALRVCACAFVAPGAAPPACDSDDFDFPPDAPLGGIIEIDVTMARYLSAKRMSQMMAGNQHSNS